MKFKILREGRGVQHFCKLFDQIAKTYPDMIAIEMKTDQGWERIKYGELLKIVRKFALGLKDRFNVKEGDHIAIRGKNSPEWIISALTVHWIGGVVVPIDARLTEKEVIHILNMSDSSLFITDNGDFCNAVPILRFNDIEKNLIEPGMDCENAEDLDRLSILFFTSGTTGNSKGVMLSMRNVMSNVDDIYKILIFNPGDRQFLILPLHHVFPYTVSLLLSISSGLTLTIARSYKSNELKEDMKETKPHIMLVVPLLLEKIVVGIEKELRKQPSLKRGMVKILEGVSSPFTKINFRDPARRLFRMIREALGMDNMRYLVSGGAALPPWVSKRLETWGFPILQGYGLSETSPVLTVNPPYRPKNASAGLPIPSVEINILNPVDGVGEIVAKGPNIMLGYYKNEKATEEVFTKDGWFRTGDMGYLDKDGFLFITGRAKSVIVTRGGKNIYPEEIEEKLNESPFIEESLVLMETNLKTGLDEIVSYIYPNYENVDDYCATKGILSTCQDEIYNILEEEIKKINEHLANYKKIRRIVLREEEFPKTSTQKIKRYLFIQKGREIT